MKNVLIALALTLSSSAFAGGSQTLFTMTNDRDRNVDSYSINLDANGNPATFVLAPNGQNPQTYSFADIASANGVVLIESQGHKVLLLQGSLAGEGRFHMTYLANGLSNQYATCDFLLKKSGDQYFAQNAYNGTRITQTKIISWSLGLKTLQGICK